jgi:hyaluronate lyase
MLNYKAAPHLSKIKSAFLCTAVKQNLLSILCILGFGVLSEPAKADVFDNMRLNWTRFLTAQNDNNIDSDTEAGINNLNIDAGKYWKELRKDSLTRTLLWTDLTYTYSKDITTSYRRLTIMALAYSTNQGKLYHNTTLLVDIFSALQWLYKNHYNENTRLPIPMEGSDIHNWWDYKIGTALEIDEIVILLYDVLNAKQRNQYMQAINHFSPNFEDAYTRKPAVTEFTAANRVWVSTVICLRGIILKDASRIALASKALTPIFKDAETGDGFYADGSFIQHVKHPYTGGYGISLLGRLSEEVYLLSGSPWALSNTYLQHIYNWVYNAFAPVIYKGNVMSMVEGREISRPDAQGNRKGINVVQSIALLARAAPPNDAARLRGLIKYWFANGVLKDDSFIQVPVNYIAIIKATQSDTQPAIMPQLYLYRQFAHMDRAVQQTPEYAFGISMHSARIFNYETRTNYENIKGWHTSDGQTYLYNADAEQFNNDFWATVNYYRLPGTTVENQTEVPGFKNSNKHWVGGAGLKWYGVAGMNLSPAGQTLTAKKSWFMFDGKIVALGAGITNQDNEVVNTYIEQRKLRNDDTNTFIINGKTLPQTFGLDANPLVSDNVQWAHLSGNVQGADIGYYFPEKTSLRATRNKQTGSWKSVNVNQNSQVFTHTYLTLWKTQGIQRSDNNKHENKYAYVLLPGFSPAATKAYASKPDITIIENTAGLQAVKSESLNLLAANFWQKTLTAVNLSSRPEYLTCSGQAAVLVLKEAGTIQIAVADPTMLNDSITLTLKENASRITYKDAAIKVTSVNPVIKLVIDTAKLEGQTVKIILESK